MTNAEIARLVQSGKLSASPQYAQAAAGEMSRKSNIDLSNTDAKNRASEFGINSKMSMNTTGAAGLERLFALQSQAQSPKLDALSGMSNLYGTTPALSNLYGDQSIKIESMNQKQPKIKRKTRGVKFHLPAGR